MSLEDIYNDVSKSMENQKPALIELLETHIDFETIIPANFYNAFYQRHGRSHIYHLESFVRSLVLQKLLGISTDALLLSILKLSAELREFCGFIKVPDASQLTHFRANYCEHLKNMFEALVDLTDRICRKINAKKADYLVYDTTGIELPVAENNPKFFNTKLKEAKKLAKGNPDYDPYRGVYSLLPDASSTNPDAHQQYINGHFCYALKLGVLTDGLGIPRDTPHWDNLYRHRVVVERTINLMKDTFVLDSRKSFRSVSAKADTYLCAITQLVGVLLADSIHKLNLFKSLRKLIA